MMRNKYIIEALIGNLLIFGFIWLVQPLHNVYLKAFLCILVFLYFITTNIYNRESPRDIGFRLDNCYDSLKPLLSGLGIWSQCKS